MALNFEVIKSTLEAAGQFGSTTVSLINSVVTVKELLQKSDASSDPEIKLALSELAVQVADAQLANADLKRKLAAALDELGKEQSFKSDMMNYELWETPTGSIVYRLKESEKGEGPMRYLCPNCVENRKTFILQGHEAYRSCPSCGAAFTFKEQSLYHVSTRRNPTDGYL